jgi:hypothetical protein
MIIHCFTSRSRIFTYMETSPLPVKGYKMWPMLGTQGLWLSLSREGSLSCHTCCDTGPRFFWSHPKDLDRPIQSPLTTQGDVEDLFLYSGRIFLREYCFFFLRNHLKNLFPWAEFETKKMCKLLQIRRSSFYHIYIHPISFTEGAPILSVFTSVVGSITIIL